MDKLTVIVPCYNEEEVLPVFYQEVKKVLDRMEGTETELLFIDDGSKDNTLKILRMLDTCDERCRYIAFSRNFGKEAAMYAGLEQAKGDYCVIMDADLQHPPALLPEMYRAVKQEGFDCCAGFRKDRNGEGRIRSFLSKAFYKVIQKMSHMNMEDGAGDFRMMSRKMVDSILACKEYNRYMKGIFTFVGFDTKWIPFENVERAAGKTKWGFKSLFRYALDGIFSFSTTPITIAAVAGVLLFVLSLVYGIGTGIHTLIFGNKVSGYTTIVCLILFLNGIQLLVISVLGEYISKNYMESKGRPIYIVKESSGRSAAGKV